jgi:hypothetical protein
LLRRHTTDDTDEIRALRIEGLKLENEKRRKILDMFALEQPDLQPGVHAGHAEQFQGREDRAAAVA